MEQEYTYDTIPVGAHISYERQNGDIQEGVVVKKMEQYRQFATEKNFKSITVQFQGKWAGQRVRLTQFKNVRFVE